MNKRKSIKYKENFNESEVDEKINEYEITYKKKILIKPDLIET